MSGDFEEEAAGGESAERSDEGVIVGAISYASVPEVVSEPAKRSSAI
jgi:hypothetical protein